MFDTQVLKIKVLLINHELPLEASLPFVTEDLPK